MAADDAIWLPFQQVARLLAARTVPYQKISPSALGLRTGRQAAEWVLVLFWLDFHALAEGKACEDKKNGDDCDADPLCSCHDRPIVAKRLL
jgi:hypothetical protein